MMHQPSESIRLTFSPVGCLLQSAILMAGLILAFIGTVNPLNALGGDSDSVTAFKRFLLQPPESGHALFRFRSGNSTTSYEAVWFDNNFFFSVATNQAEHGIVSSGILDRVSSGRWEGKLWMYSEATKNLTYYEAIPETMLGLYNEIGALGDERILGEFFTLGIQRLAPGSIKLTGNMLDAKLRDGTKIKGSLKENAQNQVGEIAYETLDSFLKYKIFYDYKTPSKSNLPTVIRFASGYGDKPIEEKSCLEVIDFSYPLAATEWAKYNPATLFSDATVRVESKAGSFRKVGQNLVPTTREGTGRNPWPMRLFVYAIIGIGAIVMVYIVIKVKKSNNVSL